MGSCSLWFTSLKRLNGSELRPDDKLGKEVIEALSSDEFVDIEKDNGWIRGINREGLNERDLSSLGVTPT